MEEEKLFNSQHRNNLKRKLDLKLRIIIHKLLKLFQFILYKLNNGLLHKLEEKFLHLGPII